MEFDPMLIFAPLLGLLLAITCAAVVCVVALCRAERTDVVATVRALPDLVATFLRHRRKKR
ncbi:hypothetical protein [Streptomyces subrutilus]|uniref:hypothetical protein n=1 Tax=Streptomyces subrutilus TaxID=36818 RepID=UPI002E105428|nr:hypothetical protein OG479_35110 [Streptomyces subrutilus]